MSNESVRSQIINALCKPSLFPSGLKMHSWEVCNQLREIIPQESIDSVKDFDNSVREALETVDGYIYANGTSLKSRRGVTKRPCPPDCPCHGKGTVEYIFD